MIQSRNLAPHLNFKFNKIASKSSFITHTSHNMSSFNSTSTQFTKLPSGINVFHRSAGPKDGSVVLLLHGFPTSSTQYQHLIPVLANSGYRVIAPDLPGFGFTEIPDSLNYKHTFANLAETVDALLTELKITKFAVYIMDYGAPTGLRLALKRPDQVTALITQNGNAYDEGLGSFWDPLRTLWKSEPGTQGEKDARAAVQDGILTYAATKWQYQNGEPDPDNVDPAPWELDWALMNRPGNFDVQLDLFKSYGSNVPLYPEFQEWFRKTQVPTLAAWGKNDLIFVKEGAQPYKKDLPNAEIHLLDGGHFIGVAQPELIGKLVLDFLQKNKV